MEWNGVDVCRQLGSEEFSSSWSGNGSHELFEDDDPSLQEQFPGGKRGSCS